ncbi:MAG: tyrosine-type recombinase/integrase [Nanoarchaeota archaeon]|nr:tyrosine-type recombinase/integrase [Nanoarchaeota archaeon]MBU1643915.1 tyrosine-type recombinase/integrase [Nanoarchaeota archaeon]MBU1976543.1 tyrosine-type recombinase/integrase [Nanoarchaeota archaeon]
MDFIELVRKEALRRGYSIRTIKTYQDCLRKFFRTCHKEPKKVTKKDVTDYLDQLVERNKAGSTLNVYLSALNFLFLDVLNKKLLVNIRYSRKPKRLPEVLNKEELVKLFEAISNKKHQLMVLLMYSAGLRVSEMLNLRVRDFDFTTNLGIVRDGKGGKERFFLISERLKPDIINWFKDNGLKNDSFLFNSYQGRMSASTVRMILKKSAQKAGIKRRVHPHLMRHCFGTDVVKDGHTEAELQPLMGHNSIETTRGYVHVANAQMTKVKSPFDNL